MARRLLEAGLEPGGRVGIHLRPELALHWLVSYSAAHRAGGVAVPMNPRLAPAEVAHILEHSGATIVVADGDLLHSDGVAGAGRLVSLIDAGAEGGRCRRARPGPCPLAGARPPPATLAVPGAAHRPRTWPTSSTPRGRPAAPRAWPSATPTGR